MFRVYLIFFFQHIVTMDKYVKSSEIQKKSALKITKKQIEKMNAEAKQIENNLEFSQRKDRLVDQKRKLF